MLEGSFKGKNFLQLEDFTPEELRYLLDLSIRMKKEKKAGVDQRKDIGKNMLMLFEMESTRTRCSFETSAQDLGMGTTYLSNSHFGTKETIKDSMRVFSAMYDVIAYRGKEHSQLLEMTKDCTIPIINGYTMHEHPTQMLADFMTESIRSTANSWSAPETPTRYLFTCFPQRTTPITAVHATSSTPSTILN